MGHPSLRLPRPAVGALQPRVRGKGVPSSRTQGLTCLPRQDDWRSVRGCGGLTFAHGCTCMLTHTELLLMQPQLDPEEGWVWFRVDIANVYARG